MRIAEIPAGTVEYDEVGDGPPVYGCFEAAAYHTAPPQCYRLAVVGSWGKSSRATVATDPWGYAGLAGGPLPGGVLGLCCSVTYVWGTAHDGSSGGERRKPAGA